VARSQHAADGADHPRRRMLLAILATLLGVVAVWWWLGDPSSTNATASATAPTSSDSSRWFAYAWLSGARPVTRLRVSPSAPGRHEHVTVTFHSRRATGDFGEERRSYTVQAWSVHPASGCVNNRDRVLAARPAGYRLRGRLDPARGDGGGLGWCPGRFKGKVIYAVSYACPAKGTCQPPKDFRGRREVAARFSFLVR
jgi:hypothetical protein